MSRPLAYKITDLDTRVNLSENSTSFATAVGAWICRELLRLSAWLSPFPSAVIESLAGQSRRQPCPASHRSGVRGKSLIASRSIRAPDISSRVVLAFVDARIAFNVLGLVSPRPGAKGNAAVGLYSQQA